MNKLNELLNFKNKKERDDFLIALVVLAFFGGLIWWISPQFSAKTIAADGMNIVPETMTTNIDSSDNDTKDKRTELYDEDENNYSAQTDSLHDTKDKHPIAKGLKQNQNELEVKIKPEEANALQEAVQNVEFKTASAELLRTSRTSLYRIVKIMNNYPDYRLSIVGHTDNQGEAVNNKTLSVERAKTCYNYFIENGIEASRMQYKGYGESRPIDTNDTAEGRKNNRRVEFDLTY